MSKLTANFEDIYPLTPFQQGMLFYVLDTPDAGLYLDQQKYTLRGELDDLLIVVLTFGLFLDLFGLPDLN